jgi:hypothetical protein
VDCVDWPGSITPGTLHSSGEMVELTLSICVLSVEETARLEHWNAWPTCKGHRHVDKAEATALVADATHRWVGGDNTKVKFVSAIVRVPVQMWEPIACRNWDGHLLQGLRVWGNRATR